MALAGLNLFCARRHDGAGLQPGAHKAGLQQACEHQVLVPLHRACMHRDELLQTDRVPSCEGRAE